MIKLQALVKEYVTTQGDVWDVIALRCYRDEHGMHYLQDANFLHRFTGFFKADVRLEVPPEITLEHNLKPVTPQPDIRKMLPWR